MTKQPDLFEHPVEYGDITARKHGGNVRSIEANSRVDKELQQGRIIACLAAHGPKTGAEIARLLGLEYHRCSGRFKALRDAGLIEWTGNKRAGGNEYRLVKGM